MRIVKRKNRLHRPVGRPIHQVRLKDTSNGHGGKANGLLHRNGRICKITKKKRKRFLLQIAILFGSG
jgi:hypothetical protein